MKTVRRQPACSLSRPSVLPAGRRWERVRSTRLFEVRAPGAWLTVLVFLAAFILYVRTLAPSVVEMFDDSLELQLVAYQLGIAHPTGYPLYTLLGKLFTLLPFGEPAFMINLMSAFWSAAAVALLFCVTREICQGVAAPLPRVTARLAPYAMAASALAFAASPILWASATVAEVYTLNLFFIGLTLVFALRCAKLGRGRGALALVYGLSLTHHRTMLLLAPALVVFGLLSAGRAAGKQRRAVDGLKLAVLFALPLALYLYLPLRGLSTTSLDGTYENSLAGFLRWVAASGYGVFLTANPWGFTGDPASAYGRALIDQFSLPGVALALVGIFGLLRQPKVWLLLVLSLTATASFALLYRVADPEPFYLASFFIFAILAAAGAVTTLEVVEKALEASRMSIRMSPRASRIAQGSALALLAVAFLAVPAGRTMAGLAASDRSAESTVLSYGLDAISQPIEKGAAIVGIGGEMTLLKYLQSSRSLRPDLSFVTADEDEQRLREITARVDGGQQVYTTRPLAGLAARFALRSVGPLIEVLPQTPRETPSEAKTVSQRFGGAIELAGYALEESTEGPAVVARGTSPGKASPTVRLTLFWRVHDRVPRDYNVFVHVVSPTGNLAGQRDGIPVSGAYPTSRWREGEVIVDTYDVPLLVGAPPGSYTLKVGLYDATGSRLLTAAGAYEVSLGTLQIVQSVPVPPGRPLDVERREAAMGEQLKLLGYRLGLKTARPGDTLEVHLLWQALGRFESDLETSLSLVDAKGARLAQSAAQPIASSYPTTRWQVGEVVREIRSLAVPADLADGVYQIVVDLTSGSKPVGLASIEVKGRKRAYEQPPMQIRLDAPFEAGMTLLGFDLAGGATSPTLAPGNKLGLTLYWQSRGKVGANFTVFVHLVGGDGRPVTQHDSPPQLGMAPTATWTDGEVIADGHELVIPSGTPAGQYRILVGLYDPATGRRLTTTGGDNVEVGRVDLR